MQVLRVGGEHLAGRRQKARTARLLIAGAGTAGVVALSVGLHPLAGVAFAITAASAVAKAHRSLRRTTKGIRGETAVAELLRSLPDDYFLLNDVVLPGHPGNIDHVVVGPCGVLVIETKNFSGSVESRGNAWFVNGRRFRSISKQANHGAIAVRETLSRLHPDLEGSVLRYVDSIAVFTNPSSRVGVDRAKTIVARYSQLLDVILAIARRKRVPPAVAARLAESLINLVSNNGLVASEVPARSL
jgi:Nuclease-related domain